jgi:hypothetical protein
VRGVSLKHLEQHNSKSVEIRLVRVEISLQGLWSHVERSANINSIFESEASLCSKSKIADFPFIAYPKYISRLDIPMNDSFSQKIAICGNELIENFDGSILSKLFFGGDVLIQISMGAVLHY